MKIDFNAHFREVEKLLRAGIQPEPAAEKPLGQFNHILEQISPDQPKTPEKTALLEQNPKEISNKSTPNSGPMASLNPAPPRMLTPGLDPLGVDLEAPPSIDTGLEGVKIPTVLDAKRIKISVENTGIPPLPPQIAQVRRLVENAGVAHGIDPLLSMAVVKAESAFNSKAVSSDGHESKGLFQLLDTTGAHLHKTMGVEESYDPFNPSQNVNLGVGYLRYLHDIFNQSTELPGKAATIPAANSSSLEKLAVAAFNAGEGRVASAQERAKKAGLDASLYENIESYLPEITRQYVARVLTFKNDFESTSELQS